MKHRVLNIDGIATCLTSVNLELGLAKGFILNDDFTTSPCYVAKRGYCFAHGKTADEAIRDVNLKFLNNLPLTDRLNSFVEQFPLYNEKYNAIDLFNWHNTLTGSCEYGRNAFCKNKNINIELDKFTIKEFIELTKDEYNGCNVIKLIDIYEP